MDGRVQHMDGHRGVSPCRAERRKSHKALHGRYVGRCVDRRAFEHRMVFHRIYPRCGKPSSSSVRVPRSRS